MEPRAIPDVLKKGKISCPWRDSHHRQRNPKPNPYTDYETRTFQNEISVRYVHLRLTEVEHEISKTVLHSGQTKLPAVYKTYLLTLYKRHLGKIQTWLHKRESFTFQEHNNSKHPDKQRLMGYLERRVCVCVYLAKLSVSTVCSIDGRWRNMKHLWNKWWQFSTLQLT